MLARCLLSGGQDEFQLLFKRWNVVGVQREKDEQLQMAVAAPSGSPPHSGLPVSPSSPGSDEPSSPPSHSPAAASSGTSSPPSLASTSLTPIAKRRRYYPVCLIGQRDVFRIQLIPVSTQIQLTWNGSTRRVTKTQWHFPRGHEPDNYTSRQFPYASQQQQQHPASKVVEAEDSDGDDYRDGLDETVCDSEEDEYVPDTAPSLL